MEFWGALLNFLETKMFWAKPYDWFHISFFVISIVAGVWLALKFKNPTHHQVRSILLTISILCIVLEIYKQIVYSFSYDGEKIIFNYTWYVFPWQFCSTPMYIGLLAGLTKNNKLHEGFCAYLASYAVFAGLSVMIYPSAVLTDIIGINIQTMLCHGSMITIGIFLICTGYVKTNFRTFLKAVPIFLIAFAVAVILNESANLLGILEQGEFNMFYISPYGKPVIPVLTQIQNTCPTPIPQIAYLIVFSLIAYLILVVFGCINRVIANRKNKSKL